VNICVNSEVQGKGPVHLQKGKKVTKPGRDCTLIEAVLDIGLRNVRRLTLRDGQALESLRAPNVHLWGIDKTEVAAAAVPDHSLLSPFLFDKEGGDLGTRGKGETNKPYTDQLRDEGAIGIRIRPEHLVQVTTWWIYGARGIAIIPKQYVGTENTAVSLT
jgi:hypothetical protein